MDARWPKLAIASLFHRNHPEIPKASLMFQVFLKKANQSMSSHILPTAGGSPFEEVPGLGVFPVENGQPYVEYKVRKILNWQPPKSSGYQPIQHDGEWTKTSAAGICLDFPARPVPISIGFPGNDLTSHGIRKLIRIKLGYEIDGNATAYNISFNGPSANSEIMMPEDGLKLGYQLTWMNQSGQVKKGSFREVNLEATDSGAVLSLNANDLE